MATTVKNPKGSAATTSTEGSADKSQASTSSNPAGTDASSGSSGIVDSAKQAATQVLDQAKDQATSRVDQQRQTLASGLGAVAQAFQSMGNRLQHQDEGPVAQYAAEMGQAMGGQVERLAKYLQGRSMQELVTDVESFARRSPGIFLGSTFVLGLAASRFLKSSRPAGSGVPANITDPSHLLPPAPAPASGTMESVRPSGAPASLATTSGAGNPGAGSGPESGSTSGL